MSAVFADTFFFLAILNPRDPAHHRAEVLSRQLRSIRVTTAWVLTEVGDALAKRNRSTFLELMRFLRRSSLTQIIEPSADLFEADIGLYEERLDKEWPLTDCISFVVMQQQGIRDALTGDKH